MTQTTDDTKRDFAPLAGAAGRFSGVRLQSDTCTGLPT